MWIFLGVSAFVVLLITVILLLPVNVILKISQDGELFFRYKILHKTFGENPDPNNPITRVLKELTGISRLNTKALKETAQKGNLLRTLGDSVSLITGLLKRVLGLLKHCQIKVLKLQIVCAEGDAAQTAIQYGRCYAVISPLLGFLHSAMKVDPKGEHIDITCDFQATESHYEFETVLVVRVFRVLIALLRASRDEAERTAVTNQKTPASDS